MTKALRCSGIQKAYGGVRVLHGIDLAIVIKANYPYCHVLLFSGHANTALLLEEAGRKGHQFEVLAKPVHPAVMLERASALLGSAEEPLYD